VSCTSWPAQAISFLGVKQMGKVTLLGSEVPVESVLKNGNVTLKIPAIRPGELPADHAWVLKVSGFLAQ
jgi:hypothetical protein